MTVCKHCNKGNQWRKVSEGLPKGGTVIVDIWVVTERGGFRAADVTWCSNDGIFLDDFGSEYELHEVTHWMIYNEPKD